MDIQETYKNNSTLINLLMISLLLIIMISISAYATLILVGSILFGFGLWTAVIGLLRKQTKNQLKKADEEDRMFENANGEEKIKSSTFDQEVKVEDMKQEREDSVKYGLMFLLLPIPLVIFFAFIYFFVD